MLTQVGTERAWMLAVSQPLKEVVGLLARNVALRERRIQLHPRMPDPDGPDRIIEVARILSITQAPAFLFGESSGSDQLVEALNETLALGQPRLILTVNVHGL